MTKRPVRRHRLALLACALAAAFVAALGSPTPALARDYEVTAVDIDATVGEDGVLSVVETRTFAFDGSFNGVFWEIPTGHNEGNGHEVAVDVLLAGEGTADDLASFGRSGAGLDGTYEVYEEGDSLRLKIYAAHEDETVSFTIAYDATGIVTRWEDAAELYWKFVSDGWDVQSQNVTCTLHLPVPGGESVVAGDNVRAWGHGPLDAAVTFAGDDVVFTVPGVGTEEFAEMRVAFPSSWVAGLEGTSGEGLPTILSEEQRWADEANERRTQARVVYYGALSLPILLTFVTALLALRWRAKYRRDFSPQFSGMYFRDVPTDDHPAVLGALYENGEARAEGLTATLMRLTDEGVVRLDKVTTRSRGLFREKVEEDYRLTRLADAPATGACDPVDEATLDFLFCRVAGRRGEESPELLFSEVEAYAKKHPQSYSDAYDDWKGTVEGAYLMRFSGKGLRGYGKGALLALGGVDAALAFVAAVVLVGLGASLVAVAVAFVTLAAAAVLAFLVARGMDDVNRDAVETRAKLEALRRWLKEFTHLDEAVPSDVVLWNRLLVMAVVLGVADEVIDQLKVALPEMLEDPYLMPTYGWLYWHGHGMRPAAQAFSKGMDSAHEVSTAALARSSSSSGGGGGGGFSGGGGGGFGGGGGGGAF